MKTKKILVLLLAAVMVLPLVACNVQGKLYSEKNAYISLYVYDDKGKQLVSVEALRVAPIEIPEVEETDENGYLTNEAAMDHYRYIPTAMYALELAISNSKDKSPKLPEINYRQLENGEIEFTIESIKDLKVGKKENSNDIYEWVCTVEREVESEDSGTGEIKTETTVIDPFKDQLQPKYDKVVFRYQERTFRTFTVAFEISNGDMIVVPTTKFTVEGEKSELNVSNYLNSEFTNEKGEIVGLVKDALGITLSSDGKHVEKVGDVENTEDFRWICYIGTDSYDLVSDLTDVMISETKTINFEYRDMNAEETEELDEEEEDFEEEE